MAKFIKRYLTILVFYALMIHFNWLHSVIDSAQQMGTSLAGTTTTFLTPSKVFEEGLQIATSMINAVPSLNLLKISFDVLMLFISYVAIIYIYMFIASELSLNLIMAVSFAVYSCFFLGFAAIEVTEDIARNSLRKLLYFSVKLFALYPIIYIGGKVVAFTANQLPKGSGSFTDYAWLLVTIYIFYRVVKEQPDQLASVVAPSAQMHGSTLAAMGSTAVTHVKQVALGGATGGMVATQAGVSTGSAMQSRASAFGAKIGSGIQNLASGFKSGFSNPSNPSATSATSPPKTPTGSSSTQDGSSSGSSSVNTNFANAINPQSTNTQGQVSGSEKKSAAQDNTSKPAKPPKNSENSSIVQRR